MIFIIYLYDSFQLSKCLMVCVFYICFNSDLPNYIDLLIYKQYRACVKCAIIFLINIIILFSILDGWFYLHKAAILCEPIYIVIMFC